MATFLNPVKEEFFDYSEVCTYYGEIPADPPKLMEGSQSAGPPPFLNKTYEMVDDSSTNQVVSWSAMNDSFVVWDPHTFAISVLPKYFKHNNFSSFVRQLNTYGFRKVDPDRWEFANEGFLRGQKHLLKTIKRRKPPNQTSSQQQFSNAYLEVGEFGLEGEVYRLQRDKQMLMTELIKLRQEQQSTKATVKALEGRLQTTEQKQQHMMEFLARLMRNPNFLQQLVDQKEKMKEIEEAISKKRRRRIEKGAEEDDVGTSGSRKFDVPINLDIQGAQDLLAKGFTGLESVITGVEDLRKKMEYPEEPLAQQEVKVDGDLNDEFWKKLLDEGFTEERLIYGIGVPSEDVSVLTDKFGYLGSAAPL